IDFPVKPETRPYVDAFEMLARGGNSGELERLAKLRRRNIDQFGKTGFPGRRAESWRYLDLQPISNRPMLPVVTGPLRNRLAADRISNFTTSAGGSRVVLVDGRFASDLSVVDLPDGAWLGSIIDAVAAHPDILDVVVGVPEIGDHPFNTLNAAFFSDGFVLRTAPGVVLQKPIEIIHLVSGGVGGSIHTRSLVELGEGSKATILETYADVHDGTGRYWRNDVAAWRLGDGAALTRTALIEESADAVHLGEVTATLAANSKLDAFALLLGGGTVRHEANVTITGNHAECRYNGGFVVPGREEANIVTVIDHGAVGGTTSELIKGVAAGRGHGAFQGKIIVREGAQQTDAKQTSRNLILGRRASIDTKPELEILAEDVKCAHGASVGDLDEAALFYLRARGIPTDEARRLLVEGFLREPVEGVADAAIREHLLGRLSARLARLEEWA
ncbi:MAG TPA: Fe-S cluster assembly protein SufD, partial [Stellaceae bacterium]|nr:Fe-S cluster assembly protein SufD [Stellaceae bacterium]